MKTQDQRALLAGLRKTHALHDAGTLPKTSAGSESYLTPSFTDLENANRIKIARSVAAELGIASPFFRQIDRAEGQYVWINGKRVLNFASYDYLSLNQSTENRVAVIDAVTRWGVSSTASRLVGGEHNFHAILEESISGFLGTQATIALVSGYLANQTAIRTLVGTGDLVLIDALAHNSLYEGVKSSRADHLSFPHNDFDWLEARLSTSRGSYNRVLIVLEGLYSMDGDTPDLRRVIDLKKRFGAWLMLDEAHSIGVLGETGRGLCEEHSVDPNDIDVLMGTLSKSFAACGGFLSGRQEVIEIFKHAAPGFVYSVGLPAPVTAAASSSLDQLARDPDRVRKLKRLGTTFLEAAKALGLDTGKAQGYAIVPIILGDSLKATFVSNALLERGFNVLPIISPAVENKSARLRFFLNWNHSEAEIEAVLTTTKTLIEAGTQSV